MIKKIGLYRCKTSIGVQWRVRWYGRYDPNIGKSKRYSKTFALKKDADKYAEKKRAEIEGGMLPDLSNKTLKEYAEKWLQNKTFNEGLRIGTVTLYKETLCRLYSYFGEDCLLQQISRSIAKDFLAKLRPLQSKHELSGWTRNRILRNCKTFFGDAVDDGLISQNPFTKIKSAKTATSQWYRLKPEEYKRLLEVTDKLADKTLYALCFTAGLRLSEALTLRWSDVDFDKGLVHITNQPATEKTPSFEIKDNDERKIPLPKHTLKLLLQLQVLAPVKVPYVLLDKQRYERILSKWDAFRRSGRPWKNRNFANNCLRNFKLHCQRAGIKPIGKLTIHVLRKCCIQNWADCLPMNVVAQLAGHSDISTTTKFYSAVDEHHLAAAAKVSDELLNETTDLKMTFSDDLTEKTKDDKIQVLNI